MFGNFQPNLNLWISALVLLWLTFKERPCKIPIFEPRSGRATFTAYFNEHSVGGEIGLESHSNLDQFLRLEAGFGLVKMGPSPDNLSYQATVSSGYVVLIPAGTYHNLINVGAKPIKLYSIYAPPQHPRGTVHQTKEIADAAEENH